jgi:glycosyltransferase involved in cell wall biosynthesis
LPGIDGALRSTIRIVRGAAAGPAAARNVGWRSSDAEWIAFLDDDVEPSGGWAEALADDLAALPDDVGASQGRIRVPRPADRAPTDWERNVAGLESARWATADMAYRRSALERVGGFDERFPRAYREDADIGLRVVAAGYRIVTGLRETVHPVRPADAWVSVRLQTGNADDALMRRLHGAGWRHAAGVPRGRRPLHVATVTLGVTALVTALLGYGRVAVAAAVGWLAGTTELAIARIAPGPRTAHELLTMIATSIALPWAATYHFIRGIVRARAIAPLRPGSA